MERDTNGDVDDGSVLIHASCVLLDGEGVLLLGSSGSGKSDLALRLIDSGASLVADDQVRLCRTGDRLEADAPAPLRGLIELRGLGIHRTTYAKSCTLKLAVELQPSERLERLPEPDHRSWLGIDLPLCRLDPRTASAGIKIKWALTAPRVA